MIDQLKFYPYNPHCNRSAVSSSTVGNMKVFCVVNLSIGVCFYLDPPEFLGHSFLCHLFFFSEPSNRIVTDVYRYLFLICLSLLNTHSRYTTQGSTRCHRIGDFLEPSESVTPGVVGGVVFWGITNNRDWGNRMRCLL